MLQKGETYTSAIGNAVCLDRASLWLHIGQRRASKLCLLSAAVRIDLVHALVEVVPFCCMGRISSFGEP